MSSTAVGKAGGAVKLMNLNRRNIELLIATKLTAIFEIFNDEQDAVSRCDIRLRQRDDARVGIVGCPGRDAAHSVKGRVGRSRYQQCRSATDDFCGNRRDLLGRLAQTQHDFREALPHGAVMIDSREAQIFERTRAKCTQKLLLGFGRLDLASGETRDQCFQLCGIHREAIVRTPAVC